MKDRLFLAWLHDRIASHEGSDANTFANTFFMHKLRSIINSTSPEQETAIDVSLEPGRLLDSVALEQSVTEYLKAKGLQP